MSSDALDTDANTAEQGKAPASEPERLEKDGAISKEAHSIEKDVQGVKQTLGKDHQAVETRVLQSPDAQKMKQDIKAVEQMQVVQLTAKVLTPYEEFLRKFNNDWSINLAGAVAYHLLTAMFPIAIVLISILSVINAGAQQLLFEQLKTVLPASLSSTDVINTILHKLPRGSGTVWVIAVLIALFTGSRLFILLDGCFNIIYQVHARTLLRKHMMAIGMLLLFVVLTPVMIAASSAPALVLSILGNSSMGKVPQEIIVSVLGILGSFVASLILFGAIYVIVPNQHIRLGNIWRGTLIAAVALQIYLILFPIYATHFLSDYAGQVGFAIILLVFFFYFAVILLLGAEVNAFYAEGVRSNTLSTLIHTYVDANRKRL